MRSYKNLEKTHMTEKSSSISLNGEGEEIPDPEKKLQKCHSLLSSPSKCLWNDIEALFEELSKDLPLLEENIFHWFSYINIGCELALHQQDWDRVETYFLQAENRFLHIPEKEQAFLRFHFYSLSYFFCCHQWTCGHKKEVFQHVKRIMEWNQENSSQHMEHILVKFVILFLASEKRYHEIPPLIPVFLRCSAQRRSLERKTLFGNLEILKKIAKVEAIQGQWCFARQCQGFYLSTSPSSSHQPEQWFRYHFFEWMETGSNKDSFPFQADFIFQIDYKSLHSINFALRILKKISTKKRINEWIFRLTDLLLQKVERKDRFSCETVNGLLSQTVDRSRRKRVYSNR